MYVKIIVSIFLPLLLLSVQAEAQEYPPDIQRIMDRGKLIVAMYVNDIPPFYMHDEKGKFYGLDVELSTDIAEKLGVEVEFKRDYKTFSEIVEGIVRHEADVAVTLLSRTLDRAKKVRFTRPYIILRQGLLISRIRMAQRERQLTLMEILNHPGSEIGVKAGTSYIAFAKQLFPTAKIREYPEWDPDIIAAVLKGEVIAAFHDEIEIKKVVIGKPETALHLQTVVLKDTEDPIAMAVPWDSTHLHSWLELYLETVHPDWTTDKLLKKYSKSVQKEN
jgi:ABC-type amino acid transport substrate-binding protein